MVCYFLQTRCDRRKVRISTEMRMDSRSSGIEETECADFFFPFLESWLVVGEMSAFWFWVGRD